MKTIPLQYAIGVDLGGTNLKVGAVSPEGEVLFRTEMLSGVQDGREIIVKKILNTIEETRHKIKGKRLTGIGLGIPGLIDVRTGTVTQSPNLDGWAGFSLRNALEGKLSWPHFIENDANAYTLGEGWVGAASGIKNFSCLTLGTGIGGGIVLDGNLVRGADGMAGEIGHTMIEPDGVLCGCGLQGCLEKYASANALVRTAQEEKDHASAQTLLKSAGGAEQITAKLIADLARKGDEFCIRLFQRLARYLGRGLSIIVNLLNVEMVVIGGGLANSSDLFLENTIQEMKKRSLTAPGDRVKVVPAKLGDSGGIIGSAHIAFRGGKV